MEIGQLVNGMIARSLPALPRGLVRRVAGRYIAGDSAELALALARGLKQAGFESTVHILGEDVTNAEEAARAAESYLDLMESMQAAGVSRNVSVKPSQLGIRFDEGRAFELLREVLASARQRDFFVRLDMEDSSLTDVTLDLHRRAREIWPRVGTVLQARLLRTPDDARALAGTGASIRLCKGIYAESRSNALQGKQEIREAFMEVLRLLLEGGAFVGLATHDLDLIGRVRAEVLEPGDFAGRLEFQALLGVPIRSTLESLRDEGYPVRLYVPFGHDWYAYALRRVRESPQIAGSITRSLFSRDRLDASSLGERGS